MKTSTREKQGKAMYWTKVEDRTPIPKNCTSVLQCSDNKQSLFEFMAKKIYAKLLPIIWLSWLLVTVQEVLFQLTWLKFILSATRGDSRIVLHCLHQAGYNMKFITVRTIDSCVVVLLIAKYFIIGVDQLFVPYGKGKSFHYIPFTTSQLHLAKRRRSHFFRALSGWDIVSTFLWYGKGGF